MNNTKTKTARPKDNQKLTKEILIALGTSVVKQLSNKKGQGFSYLSIKGLRNALYKKGYNQREVANSLYYLKLRKYINTDGGRDSQVALTTKGAIQYCKYCSLSSDKKLAEGYISIVVLEIPEQKRDLRDFLRRRLIESGFELFGRGVYTSRTLSINSENLAFVLRLFALEKVVLWGQLHLNR